MKEIVYIKAETKVNRMHHRFITKKRNWLIRQIDPAKRYLHMLKKQVKNQEAEAEKRETENAMSESMLHSPNPTDNI